MNDPDEFPEMPQPGGRGHALEASASMVWTLLFLAYSSSTFVGEFGEGWPAAWTIFLVILPVTLAGTPAILDRHPRAVLNVVSYILYVLIPSLIQLLKPQDSEDIAYQLADVATVLIIWLPFELKLLSEDVSPTRKVTVWPLLTAELNIVNIFTVLRPLSKAPGARQLGYSFKFNVMDIVYGFSFATLYALIAILVATSIRFARFKRPAGLKPAREFAAFTGMYMSAIAEELLFHGLIQNMLEQRLGAYSPIALIITSVAYGIAHVKRSKLGFEPPNYRYAAVATVTGLMSGLAWQWTGKVTASAITHAVGDFILWRATLTKLNVS